MKNSRNAAADITASAPGSKAPEYVIDIVNLTKSFKRQQAVRGGYSTFKSLLLNIFSRKAVAPAAVTQAVSDLTLRIRRGASVGIIGSNGSGKSTLLKLITGIYKPTKGRVTVDGRIAALIELGAGFHPDFTGRENLYLGGVMHGLTRKQIDERFDDIIQFAELAHVIDDPIRTYSSGMFMRLGFSLAVHTDPDVLIVDEVLAVGDAAFVIKCKERIARLRKEGKTLLLVSHDLDAIERWCDEAIWLQSGVAKDRGDPRRVIDHYRQYVEKGEEEELKSEREEEAAPAVRAEEDHSAPRRWGSREIEIFDPKLLDKDGQEKLLFHPDDSAQVVFSYRVHQAMPDAVFGIGISRTDGVLVHGSNTDIEKVDVPQLREEGRVCYRIERLGLLDGHFVLDLAVHRADGYPYDYHKGAITFAVRSAFRQVGVCVPVHQWSFDAEVQQHSGRIGA